MHNWVALYRKGFFVAYADSEGLDQTVHSHSLFRAVTVHLQRR